jgi:4-phosphopantoate--beta-alanine ligase
VKEKTEIPPDHPRAESLRIRERLVRHYKAGIVAEAGLFAHGRGETFDYLLGEATTENALKAMEAAAAALLTAKHPVISVNGNTAALAAKDIVDLAHVTGAKIEVNLFYRTLEREVAIRKLLEEAGAQQVLGVGDRASARIPEIGSERRRVDPAGILVADVVLVPLEDGDRTEALVKTGKKVIAIDLNPLSRTAQFATITIVDNITRAMPTLVKVAQKLKGEDRNKLETILSNFNNKKNLAEAIAFINQRLSKLAEKGIYISVSPKGQK